MCIRDSDQITLYDDRISERQVKAVAELTGLKEAIESLENGYDTYSLFLEAANGGEILHEHRLLC